MTTPIVRVYDDEKQARDAARKLKAEGFSKASILLVSPSPRGEAQPVEAMTSSGVADLLPRGHAQVYAQGVQQGRALLVIRPPFGQGQLAKEVMNSFGPVSSGPGVPAAPSTAWEVGAPLSSGFRLPVLWRRQPEPLSRLLGRPSLTRGRTFQDRYPELKDPHWTFSSRLGIPPLSRNQRPRASLSGRSGPAWRRSFGLPMLSGNPAPFSSTFGMHLLTGPLASHHPAPFSERAGLPLLSSGRTFLSRLFGELASPHFALFGRGPLSGNATPLSAMMGQPVLWTEPTPLSSKFDKPVLLEAATPLSTRLALPLIWRNPAPLSSLVRLPLLSRYQ
jgi:hypothetical protein